MTSSFFIIFLINFHKLTKKNSKTDIGGPDSGEGRFPNSSETLRDGARTFRTLRKRFATTRGPSELFGNASRRREDLPNSSETLRDGARTFRTLWKRFAASRRPSELFGNASRRREDLPNSSETLRDDARTFRTLRKRFAASRNGSRTPRKGFPSELPLPFGHLPLQKGEKN